jgi:hypothetical protein
VKFHSYSCDINHTSDAYIRIDDATTAIIAAIVLKLNLKNQKKILVIFIGKIDG